MPMSLKPRIKQVHSLRISDLVRHSKMVVGRSFLAGFPSVHGPLWMKQFARLCRARTPKASAEYHHWAKSRARFCRARKRAASGFGMAQVGFIVPPVTGEIIVKDVGVFVGRVALAECGHYMARCKQVLSSEAGCG